MDTTATDNAVCPTIEQEVKHIAHLLDGHQRLLIIYKQRMTQSFPDAANTPLLLIVGEHIRALAEAGYSGVDALMEDSLQCIHAHSKSPEEHAQLFQMAMMHRTST